MVKKSLPSMETSLPSNTSFLHSSWILDSSFIETSSSFVDFAVITSFQGTSAIKTNYNTVNKGMLIVINCCSVQSKEEAG